MYQSPVYFEAPLNPRHYFSDDLHTLEGRCVFESTWQLVGLASSVSKPGQYLAKQLGSVPVVVRNFDGKRVALRNVCAHRHCELVSSASGHSEKLKCPFHGWEYGADGRTRKIPAAMNFPNFDRERFKLASFPLEQCGDLLFVRISDQGPSLRHWLGDLFERLESWTSMPDWKPAVERELTLSANWKIPVEGSLESYHIPEVHPQTFAVDPGEANSDHAFAKYSSSFFSSFNAQRFPDRLLRVWEKFILRLLGVKYLGAYEHHHVFPNLLISHTESLTLVQIIRPVTGGTSLSDVWQYGRQSRRSNPISKLTAFLWGRFTGWLSYQVLKEDIRIFSRVQRGESAAVDHAVLGRCEERLHAFQQFIVAQIDTVQRNGTSMESPPSCGQPTCHPAGLCISEGQEND